MFSSIFRRAEASVDNAVGEIGNRIVITIPFVVAFGFVTVSIWSALRRLYGSEIADLLMAIAFCIVGAAIALVIYMRRGSPREPIAPEPALEEDAAPNLASLFALLNNDAVLSALTSAAPVLLSAALRTGRKNWISLLAISAAVFFLSTTQSGTAEPKVDTPSG